jgi:hypothetical protein
MVLLELVRSQAGDAGAETRAIAAPPPRCDDAHGMLA